MAATGFAGWDFMGSGDALFRTGACRGSLLRVSTTRAGTCAAATVWAGAGGCDSSGVPHIPQKRKADEFSSPQFGQITSPLRRSLILQCKPRRDRPRARWFILEFSGSIFFRMAKTRKAKPKTNSGVRRFDAALERMRSRLNWVIIRIPFDAAKIFGVRGQIKVKGTINGFPFRTSLFPTGEGGHILLVNKRMQNGARVTSGATAGFEIELDTGERVATIPERLERILAEDRSFRSWYDQLNHSTRSEIAKWVSEPKSAEARLRRSEQIAERLLETMEAERELPPLLRVAFARNPRAAEGWEQMSLARRRSHLLGIFYYRTPSGRENRIGKMLDDATALAEKKKATP